MVQITLALALFAVPAPATVVRTVAGGSDSPVHERIEVVIRTPAEWRTLWARFAPDEPVESIDFSQEMVVGVFVGARPSKGYRVDVFSVARDAGVVVVRYRVHPPTQPPIAEASVEGAPFHLVAVPRDRRRVKFIETIDFASSSR